MINLFSLVHYFRDSFTFYTGGGGQSSGPTNTTVQNTNLPDYVQPYVMSMLGAAQQQMFNTDSSGAITGFKPYVPYSSNPSNYIAGFSPLQQQAQNATANMQVPGQFGQASQMSDASGMGAFNLANQANQYGGASAGVGMGGLGLGNQAAGYGAMGSQAGQQATGYGAMGAGFGQQAGMAGQNYANQATNGSIGAYMNPYIQQSLDPQLAEIRRQYGITGTQEQSQATQQGAMGGSREALMAAENQRNMGTAQNQAIAQGYNNAFTQAQQAQQYGANLGLQGAQAGIQGAQAGIAGQNAAMQGAGLGIQGAQAGMQGINTALSGLGQGITGVNAGLAGMGQANAAAGTLGQLGTQQLAAQQGVLNTQNTMGAQQQAQQQNIINQAIQNYAMQQQYPMQSLSNLSSLLHGLPLQNTTTQSYQAAPSTVSQIAGLGTGALGAAKLLGAKEGGVVKMAGGGIASLENRQRIAENYNPKQLQTEVQNGVLPQGISGVLSQDYSNLQKAAQGMQAQKAMQQAQAAAQPNPGVTELPSNLPVQGMAEGGIIAFEEGGGVYNPHTAAPGTPDVNAQIKDAMKMAVKGIVAKQNAGLLLTRDETNLLAKNGFIIPAHPQYADKPQFLSGTDPQAQPTPTTPYNPNTPPTQQDMANLQGQSGIQPLAVNPNAPPAPPAPPSAPPPAPNFGIDSVNTGLPNVAKGMKASQGPTLDKADFMPDTPSLEGIQGLREQAYKKSGVSEKPYTDMLAKLGAQEEDLKSKGKDEALGNFLAQLGFGAAAGTSPYAMQNIGAAGVGATKSLAADLKDLDARADKIGERQFAVMDAQNKFRQTGADSDLKTLTEKQNSFDAARRDYATTNAKLGSDQATRNDAMTHLQITEAGQNARSELAARLQQQGLKIQEFSANTQRLAEQKPEFFSTILTTIESDPAYQSATGEAKVKMLTSAISQAKSAASGGNDNTLRTKALDITDKYFGLGGPGSKQYKELNKTNPDAAKKLYNDYFMQQLNLAKSVVGSSTATTQTAQPYSTAGWGQLEQ